MQAEAAADVRRRFFANRGSIRPPYVGGYECVSVTLGKARLVTKPIPSATGPATQPPRGWERFHVTFAPHRDSVGMSVGSTAMQSPCGSMATNGDGTARPIRESFLPTPDASSMSTRAMTFHELYSRYAGDVYRFAHWLTGNPADAQDITSETFARVWTATEEPRLESVKAYLFTIARNLHRKQWRRRSREQPLDEEAVRHLADPERAPDDAAEFQEEFRLAMEAVQTLPELDRTVLLLRGEQELSYEDIAVATGLSVVAAKVRVFRARAKLATLLATQKDPKP